eukprot:Phypoly_transcript_08858.p1 GENE.Phypoly_transcript_08858~~Phypoly_transcript_08858.p1  ORF type:complete len:479 (+),score=42.82 Phypoly_transcript_08858:114-1439(+)
MRRATWWFYVLVIVLVLVISYTFFIQEIFQTIYVDTHDKPNPPAFTKCKEISENILKCKTLNSDAFLLAEQQILALSNDSQFMWTYDKEIPTNPPRKLCREELIYELNCVKTVYHMAQIRIVDCPQTPHIHLLPNEQEHLSPLPPPTTDYPRAPPFSGDPNYKVRIAYSILVHGSSKTFERLIRMLYHPDHIFVVHIDKETSEEDVRHIKEICALYKVHIIPERFAVLWGGFSIMYAFLATLNFVKDYEWDFWVHLSGVDFPLKSTQEITDFLRPKVGYSFIHIKILGPHNLETEEIYFECAIGQWAPQYMVNGTKKFKDVILPLEITWIYGSQWMILSRNMSMYLLYHPNARYLIERSRYIYIPDEKTFHTILYNTPEFTKLIVPDPYRYYQSIIPEEDAMKFRNASQPNLFARKWADNEIAQSYVDWFVANKPTFAPPT